MNGRVNRTRMRWALVCAALLLCSSGCADEGGGETVKSGKESPSGPVRKAAVAGQFYPGSLDSLAREVDRYLAAVPAVDLGGEVVGIVAPHAGYMYSGSVAAHAYAAIRDGGFETAVVVAPSHRYAFRGASVYASGAYETPLGPVPVDAELAALILDESAGIVEEPRAHTDEHSLEVQVPFLQRTLTAFRIVPIVMGDQNRRAAAALGESIARAARKSGRRVLLVASTDLSHYHSQSEAAALDGRVVERLEAFDQDGLLKELAAGRCEACGGGPMAAVMFAAKELGADRVEVLKYATSGDVTGDETEVVGYLSAALVRAVEGEEASPAAGAAGRGAAAPARPYEGLTESEKRALLALARSSIEAALAGRAPAEPALRSEALDTECGAFVTLEKRGRLRGCIGYVRAAKPLWRTVSEMAVEAAFHDPRFQALSPDELPDVEIEISVLSPLEAVADVNTIEVGKHGLVIQEGARSGLLLPQVATDYGWDRETFLDHTCQKAGLPAGAWRRDGVVILRFTAEVFGEKELGRG